MFVCNLIVSTIVDSSSNLHTASEAEVENELLIQFYPENFTSTLHAWIEETVPSGKARLLCAHERYYTAGTEPTDRHAPIALVPKDATGLIADSNLDA